MNDRILFVDDDCNILCAYERQLRKQFHIATALGGEQGLATIAAHGPFAVIVSDMRMPEMDGVQFLTKTRELAPDAVRIMLTGCADLETAVEAVNEGNIFRFLTKPCAPEALIKALDASLAQYRLVMAEKELLEKTLNQSVQVLMEILGLINPIAFSRASSVQHIVRHLAVGLQLSEIWQFELAAMLSHIGCVNLLPETLEKIYAGQELSDEEQQKFAMHPGLACKLLANVPRLELIAQMIGKQQDRLARSEGAMPPKDRDIVSVGSQLLKVALEFDHLLNRGTTPETAVTNLLKRPEEYDALIVSALRNIPLYDLKMEIRVLGINDISPRMIADEDVRTKGGLLLMARGQEITYSLLTRLRSFGRNDAIPTEFRVRVPRHTLSPAELPSGSAPARVSRQ